MAIVPIYPHTFDYANERGESAAWRESVEASSACVKDIDKAVHDSYLGEYRYDLNAAAKTVIEAHGYERVNHVLAHILINCSYDGRYSHNNKDWARELGVAPDRHICCNTHPAVLDGVIDAVRKANRAVFLEVVGLHEQGRHMAARNRLTWFHRDMGEYRANPGVSDARLMARYGEIMEMKLAKEQKRIEAATPEKVYGYEIKKSVCFSNNRGFAFAHNPNAVSPYVTWQFTEESGGVRDYYWGKYFSKKEPAVKNYHKRVRDYREDYPTLTEKPSNYLRNAEMSVEQNYNMLDGAINNTPPEAVKASERPSAVGKLEAAIQAVKESSAKVSPEKGARDKKPPSLERG